MLTHLGENVESIEDAQEVASHYRDLISQIHARDLDAEISVKLTQLGLDLDHELAESNVRRLSHASGTSRSVWIDIENSAYTEQTVALYERVKVSHPAAGVCLQAYLRRTMADVRRLIPLQPAIRLVKGAYSEPRAIAYRGAEIEANFFDLAKVLLDERARGSKVRLVLGTHDVHLIERIEAYARSSGLPRSSFEVHMLYGVRVEEQRRLAAEGYLVRTLISYGEAWFPWYMRRLAERPANLAFAVRQLLPWS